MALPGHDSPDAALIYQNASRGRCRASEWSENTMVGSPGHAMLSFAMFSLLLLMGAAGDAEPTYDPVLLGNPGLER